jgi:hypothetical protein
MKTTVEIDDDLLRAAKRAAIDEGVTLRQLIEDGLRNRLVVLQSASRVEGWGSPENFSRENLYASDTWKMLDDLERAFESGRQKRKSS